MRSLHCLGGLLWGSIFFLNCTSAFTIVSRKWPKTYPRSFEKIEYVHKKDTTSLSSNRLSRTASILFLTPLCELEPPISFLSASDSYRTCMDCKGGLNSDDDKSQYVLCVAEEDDLPAISKMIVESFGAEAIQMSGDLSPLEQALLEPGVGLLNAYSGAVAYAEVLSE